MYVDLYNSCTRSYVIGETAVKGVGFGLKWGCGQLMAGQCEHSSPTYDMQARTHFVVGRVLRSPPHREWNRYNGASNHQSTTSK